MGELKPQDLYVKRKVKNSWYVHVPGKDFYCKCDSEGSADLVLSSLNTRTLPDQGLVEKLKTLADSWKRDGEHLDNSHDAKTDRAAGKVYKQCQEELMSVLSTLPDQVCKECVWFDSTDDIGEDIHEGSCGAVWEFIEGDPQENEMNYCPSCGGKVKFIGQALSTKPEADRG